MLTASREERRAYIRESANRLASILAMALSRQTAHTLLQGFSEIAEASERIGAEVYIPLLAACQDLCAAAEQGFSTEKAVSQSNEILKEAVVNIQTSLFSVALFGDMEKDRLKLNESKTKIQQFLKNGGFAVPTPALSEAVAGDSLATLSEALQSSAPRMAGTAGMVGTAEDRPSAHQADRLALSEASGSRRAPGAEPAGGDEPPRLSGGRTWSEARLASHPQMLAAIDRLIQKAWPDGRLSAELLELAAVARANYGLLFAEVCRRLSAETGFSIDSPTPAYPVETGLVPAINEQIREWLKPQQLTLTGISASARQTGRTVTLELCLKGRFVLTPEWLSTRAERLSRISGNPEEYYLSPSGELIHRTSFDLALSLFEAHEIRLGSRRYLIPACDVAESPPSGDADASAHSIIRPDGLESGRCAIALKWRERIVRVAVDELSGPARFLSKKLRSPGEARNGIVGIAPVNPAPGGVGPSEDWASILDTYAWLDSIAPEAPPFAAQTSEGAKNELWAHFQAQGARYAIPESRVAGTCDPGHFTLRGDYLEAREAAYRVVRLDESPPQPPGAGAPAAQSYLLVRCQNGIVALAIDKRDGSHPLPPQSLRPCGKLPRWISGLAGDPVSGAEIRVVNPDVLVRAPGSERDVKAGDAA